MKTVYVGYPGTGKTTVLLNRVAELDPKKTMFISFTRAAIHEATRRATEKSGLKKEEIFYFRTLHRMCWYLLGLNPTQILPQAAVMEFMKDNGLSYIEDKRKIDIDGELISIMAPETPDGNKLISIIDKIKHTTLEYPRKMERDLLLHIVSEFILKTGFRDRRLQDEELVIELIFEYEKLKDGGAYDFSDVLMAFYGAPSIAPEITTLIVDEFQDLTPLMHAIIQFFEEKTTTQIYAGDRRQAIYGFMGAAPSILKEEEESCNQRIVLPKSYRLRTNNWLFAKAIINANIPEDPIEDDIETVPGGVVRSVTAGEIIEQLIKNPEINYFILSRTNKQKLEWAKIHQRHGIAYDMWGRGGRTWNTGLARINDFIMAMKKEDLFKKELLEAFVEKLPATSYLKRGVSAKIKRGEFFPKEQELIGSNVFNQILKVGYTKMDLQMLTNALKLSENQRNALDAKMDKNPSVLGDSWKNGTLSTQHGSKGKERDICIYDAEMPYWLENAMIKDPEVRVSETLLAYVAVSRPKGELWILGNNPLVDAAFEEFESKRSIIMGEVC